MFLDTFQCISCLKAGTALPDCPKVFGDWINQGYCIALGSNPFCGPGLQLQKRTCQNGTGLQICTNEDLTRKVLCSKSGTSLPACTGIYLFLYLTHSRVILISVKEFFL